MNYRLALDIGTASCGLIALKLDENREPAEIIHHGLHIFSEPVLPHAVGETGEPKKASRRKARLARRNIDRRARRLRRIAMLAGLLDLDHKKIPADNGQHIHEVRAHAPKKRIGLDDLMRVFLKLAKRRGYAGGFRTKTDKQKDDDGGIVQPGIEKLQEAIKSADCKTVGQYLQHRFKNSETLKLKEAGLYTHRDMLVAEFEVIWGEQEKHHPILRESRPDPVLQFTDRVNKIRPLREQFREAIFYQRPLKSVAPMVGNCALEKSLPRAPMAQPAMQAFRIEKQLADLRWGMGRSAQPLTSEQKTVIRDMLNDPDQITKDGKLTFKKIYATLEKNGLMPAARRSLNMERSSREELYGNRTLRAVRDLDALEQWLTFDSTTQVRIINFLADLGSPEQVDLPDWQDRFTKRKRAKNPRTSRWEERHEKRDLDKNLVVFVNKLVENGKFGRLGDMGLESGRAGYSVRALEKLTGMMRDANFDEHAAIQTCYTPPPPTGELLMHLPPHPPTGNVVVDVALGVVRRAVNDALDKLGEPPTEVIVELSRDMALGLKARGEIEKRIDKNRKLRDKGRQELESNNHIGTERNILRYILWQQQDTHCPYCGDRISLGEAVDGNATNFEHILPRSLTRVGKQRNHLVLAHRRCNDAKRDRTPYEAFGHDEDRWNAVKYCADVLEKKKQFQRSKLLILNDYERETLDDAVIDEFSDRQLHETSWIGKLAALWLQTICPAPVAPSRGTLTAHLRRIWKLETVIAQARLEAGLPVLDQDGEKITSEEFERFRPYWEGHTGKGIERTDRKIDKRIDHRHHLIDALVIAQTSRSLYQRMAKNYKSLAERQQAGEAVRLRLFVEPPLKNVREQALALVQSANIRHKPDRQISGNFFQQTAYRKTLTEDGKSRAVIRIPLTQLTDTKGSLDKARKGISDIVSDHTRKVVSDSFEQTIASGKSVKEALAKPIYDPQFKTKIKRVAVYQRIGRGFLDGSSIFPIEHGRRFVKHYVSDGYAFVSIIENNGRIESADSVPVFRAHRSNSTPKNGERRFFRGDTLLASSNGKKYVIHQLLANATVRAAEVTESRSWIALGAESGATQFGAAALIKMTHL
ncbi:MAG: type II CRISPR RNA-guided endonuclease Cas9 [Betaproteobacteria bacterium]